MRKAAVSVVSRSSAREARRGANVRQGAATRQGAPLSTKFLSVLMSVVLVVGLCPGLAYAGDDLTAAGFTPESELTTNTVTDISAAGFQAHVNSVLYFGEDTIDAGPFSQLSYTEEGADTETVYLTYGTDYEIDGYQDSEGNPLNAAPSAIGSYKAVFKGINTYSGTCAVDFSVVDGFNIYNLVTSGSVILFYGNEIAYEPYLNLGYWDGYEWHDLTLGTDFEVSGCVDSEGDSVSAINAVGMYTVTFTGKSPYSGTTTVQLDVRDGYDISNVSASHYDGAFVWHGTNLTIADVGPRLSLFYEGPSAEERYEYVYGEAFKMTGFLDPSGNACDAVTGPGEYQAVLVGINPYSGTNLARFTVSSAYDFSSAVCCHVSGSIPYTGQPVNVEPYLNVFLADEYGTHLTLNEHYRIAGYQDSEGKALSSAPVESGSYKVVLEGLAPYSGTQTAEFAIVDPYDISEGGATNFYITNPNELVETGSPVQLDLHGSLSGGDSYTELTRGTHFEVSHYLDANGEKLSGTEAPSAAGSYSVVLEGINPYHGQRTVEFTIYAANDLARASIAVGWDAETHRPQRVFGYTGQPINVGLYVTLNGNELKEGTHYTARYKMNTDSGPVTVGQPKDIGEYSVEIQAIEGGGYTGSSTGGGFTIADPKDLSYARIENPSGYMTAYPWNDGNAVAITGYTVKDVNGEPLTEGQHYQLKFHTYENGSFEYNDSDLVDSVSDEGLYFAYAVGISPYKGKATNWASAFCIAKPEHNISLANIQLASSYVYDPNKSAGELVVPVVTLDGKTLTKNTDYYVNFESGNEYGPLTNPNSVGTHTLRIEGAGNSPGSGSTYYGVKTATYTIVDGSTPTKYTVSFDSKGGSAVTSQTVNSGANASEPADPAKNGYTFAGWFTDGGCTQSYDFSTPVTGNLTLHAGWTVTTYDIAYNLDGGALAQGQSNPANYTIETDEFELVNPTKPGYEFMGWTGTGLTSPSKNVSVKNSWGDRTYTATWRAATQVDVYRLMDPTTGKHVFTASADRRAQLMGQGWTSQGVAWKAYAANELDKASGLAAVYEFENTGSHELRYELEGPQGWQNNGAAWCVAASGVPVYRLYNSVAKDYLYTTNGDEKTKLLTADYGWTGGDQVWFAAVTGADYSADFDWLAKEYTVSFNTGNDGSAVDSQTVAYKQKATIPTPDPTRAGFTFGCWRLADGTAYDFATPVTADTVLTADWREVSYMITFADEDGKVLGKAKLGEGATAAQVEAAAPNMEDVAKDVGGYRYTFEAWSPAITEVSSDATYTATYSKNAISHTIAYDQDSLQGAINPNADKRAYTVDSPTITLKAPTKAGLTFTGWYKKSDVNVGANGMCTPKLGAKQVQAIMGNSGIDYTGDSMLCATWALADLTVTYFPNGGTLPDGTVNPAIRTMAADYTLATPARESHSFMFGGWYEADESGNEKAGAQKLTTIPADTDHDVYVSARWRALIAGISKIDVQYRTTDAPAEPDFSVTMANGTVIQKADMTKVASAADVQTANAVFVYYYEDNQPALNESAWATVTIRCKGNDYYAPTAASCMFEIKPAAVTYNDLRAMIDKANGLLYYLDYSSLIVLDDATDAAQVKTVKNEWRYVGKADYDAFEAAANKAKQVPEDADEAKIKAEAEALAAAQSTYLAAQKIAVTKKDDLTDAASAAQELLNQVVVASNSDDVAKTDKFITPAQAGALNAALAVAQGLVADSNATQADVDAALAALNLAMPNPQPGTQKEYYTLTLEGNGGTFANGTANPDTSATIHVLEGDNIATVITNSTIQLSRPGWTLGGWNHLGGGELDAAETMQGDTTLVAQWTVTNLKATFQLGAHGTWKSAEAPELTFHVNDASATVLPTPEAANGFTIKTDSATEQYAFQGWYDQADPAKKIVSAIAPGTAYDKVYVAMWKISPKDTDVVKTEGDVTADVSKVLNEATATADNTELKLTVDEKAANSGDVQALTNVLTDDDTATDLGANKEKAQAALQAAQNGKASGSGEVRMYDVELKVVDKDNESDVKKELTQKEDLNGKKVNLKFYIGGQYAGWKATIIQLHKQEDDTIQLLTYAQVVDADGYASASVDRLSEFTVAVVLNKDDLKAAIDSATTLISSSIPVASSSNQVAAGKRYVTPAEKQALQTALDDANAVYTDESAAQATVDERLLALNAALVPYKTNKHVGTYKPADSGSTTPAQETITMYRLYNPWSGEHLFTADKSEYDKLGPIGWKQEGKAWTSPKNTGDKVYRLYNRYSGDHHYTTNYDEYVTLGSIGWTQEGVAFYSGGSIKVYRGFNPYETVGTHHYTTDANEMKTMVSNGWKDEGVGWYCM